MAPTGRDIQLGCGQGKPEPGRPTVAVRARLRARGGRLRHWRRRQCKSRLAPGPVRDAPPRSPARSTYIVAKPHAVLVARGTRYDKIVVRRGDHTRHVICGGPGNDEIQGGAGDDIPDRRTPGNDFIKSGPGKNLVVGATNYNPAGAAIAPGGRDKLIGGSGRDVIVGDNLASGGREGRGARSHRGQKRQRHPGSATTRSPVPAAPRAALAAT